MTIYLRRLKKLLLVQSLFSGLWTLTNVFLPYLTMILFDHIPQLTLFLIFSLSVGYVVLILLNSFFQYLYQSFEWKLSTRFRMYLQRDLFKNTITLPHEIFYKRSENEYLSFFNNAVAVLDEEYLSPIIDMTRAIIELLFYTGALVIFVDWKIALVVIISSLLSAFIPKLVAEKLSTYRKEQLTAYEKYFKNLGELLNSKSLISPLTILKIQQRHNISSKKAQDSLFTYGKFKTLSNVLNGLAMFLVSAVSFVCVATLLYKKSITLGAAVATFSYIENFIYPIRYILTDINAIHASKKTRREMEKLLTQKEPLTLNTQPKISFSSLEIKDLSLQIANKTLLDHVNLSLNKGQKVALIGENGSGKSTLLKIISGLYAINSGILTWNHQSKKENDLFNFLFYTPQDPILFSDTLQNNITVFGSYPLNEEKLLPYLSFLPFSLNDEIDPSHLSGGEKQMVAFMRAVNTEKDLLIFDEPFSAMNFKLSQFLTKQITLNATQTIVMITHQQNDDYLSHFNTVWEIQSKKVLFKK